MMKEIRRYILKNNAVHCSWLTNNLEHEALTLLTFTRSLIATHIKVAKRAKSKLSLEFAANTLNDKKVYPQRVYRIRVL